MSATSWIRELIRGIPRFLLLLLRLLADGRVSTADKAVLAAAFAYALAPIDLMPDFIPFLGQVDDLFFLALAIDRLITNAGAELVRAHWDGPEEQLVLLCGRLDDLAEHLPGPVRARLERAAE
ncbi:MAG: DUF1232 domain-containing protein [Gemmatimonadetes bacterium]|uniref:DUF1232 domain-containing protein n=1 Tax=Candidatus Kutchimonas denitrificans TaxID=3056748 RepID=A0AAE4ZBY6_9BACT|nr:DUF1232 domain-containing protein [Gemmatimonadota bacterium]NIR75551.1 DUF1232 domain-containing protein [Candidatus Kutchimonas denitrificans]NIS01865.1 DUF1232 domain-containing protein [Gemmatimonadota bacterium]NIT67646.1 DUF1232 domain-containing protein [Gemmatimonadota bacterium]NIU53520.1 DUF1232 domain-containing protein [Gemmatimonadota bacterium]